MEVFPHKQTLLHMIVAQIDKNDKYYKNSEDESVTLIHSLFEWEQNLQA